jgi:hypothetical protein
MSADEGGPGGAGDPDGPDTSDDISFDGLPPAGDGGIAKRRGSAGGIADRFGATGRTAPEHPAESRIGDDETHRKLQEARNRARRNPEDVVRHDLSWDR